MSQPSQSDGSPALPAATVRSDALILATICEQLRVELARPAYARLVGSDAVPLAATLESLYALQEAPDSPNAVALLIESLDQIHDVGQRMRTVADDPWSTRPLNSAPKMNAYGRGETETRPLDLLLRQVKAKHDELRALMEELPPTAPRSHDPRLESLDD